MKTNLKTPLKIHGSDDTERLFDADGTYLALVSSVRLPAMLEVVRRVNAYDEIVRRLKEAEAAGCPRCDEEDKHRAEAEDGMRNAAEIAGLQ